MLRRPSEPVIFDSDQIAAFTSDFSDALDHFVERLDAIGETRTAQGFANWMQKLWELPADEVGG